MSSSSNYQDKKSKVLKLIGSAFLVIIIFILFILLSAPAILSTQWGQSRLLNHVNQRIPGEITAKKISLSWLGEQQIQELVLNDPEGHSVLTLDALHAETPLTRLFWAESREFKAQLKGLNATIVQDSTGLTNLQKALGIIPDQLSDTLKPYRINLIDAQGEMEIASHGNPMAIRLKGTTQEGSQKGSFDIDMLLTGFNQTHLHRLKATINDLPVNLLDQFMALQDPKLSDMVRTALGKTMTIHLDQNKTQEGMALNLFAESPNLKVALKGSFDSKTFSITEPGKIVFTATPEFAEKFGRLILNKSVPLEITLNQFHYPLNDSASASFKMTLTPSQFNILRKIIKKPDAESDSIILQGPANISVNMRILNLKNNAIEADFLIDSMEIRDHLDGQGLNFKNIQGQLKSNQLSRELDIKVSAHQNDSTPLFFNAHVQNLFDVNGKWNKENLSLSLQAGLKNLPAKLFCQALCLDKEKCMKLEAVFGPILNADVDVQLKQMKGPVKINLKGPKGQIYLDGCLNQHFLTLNAPLSAEVEATPQLSESILQDIIPLLGGMTHADDRLRLTIAPENFFIPISNLNVANIQMGRVVIELGNAYFNNYGQVASILSSLKASTNDQLSVWFTPIYLSVENGFVKLERFDMLALQRYPLAAWGIIDFPSDHVNMKIGLSGRSLQQAIGIAIPDRDFMLQFPLKGRIGHTKVDKSKLAAKIAALTAGIAGGPQGLVIGTVIGLASGAFREDNIPPPTTNPLPWDTSAEAIDKEESSDINPLKAVQKGASHLLKTFLR